MPTLVTPEGRAHRIENKAQLDVFAAGRPDIGWKLNDGTAAAAQVPGIANSRAVAHSSNSKSLLPPLLHVP